MRGLRLLALALAFCPPAVLAQEGSYKLEPSKEGPPADLSSAIQGELSPTAHRVLDAQGKPFATIWLRKGIPASGKPAGPKGAVQFPVLASGELLGALRYEREGGDYRDQPIAPGAYTLRYGLQPVNGDHLGVSTFRDYALLVPAEMDQAVGPLSRAALEDKSAEAAGTSHPAVLMLLAAPKEKSAAGMHHTPELEAWGAVLPLPLAVEGEPSPVELAVQLIVVGFAKD